MKTTGEIVLITAHLMPISERGDLLYQLSSRRLEFHGVVLDIIEGREAFGAYRVGGGLVRLRERNAIVGQREESYRTSIIFNDIGHRKQPFQILLGILKKKLIEVVLTTVKWLEHMVLGQTYYLHLSMLLSAKT